MAKQRKGLTDEELARYYQERRDDESLWSQTPAPVTIRKEGGTLFSLRLPADELEVFRQQAEKRGTTVSALLRDGARLLLQQDDQPGTIRYSLPLNLYRRVVASKQLIEAVLEEPQDVQDCLKLLIELGLERILTDIISGADAPTLVKAMAQLAARAPEAVYAHTTEALTLGAEVSKESDSGLPKPPVSEQASNVIPFDIDAYKRKAEQKAARLGS